MKYLFSLIIGMGILFQFVHAQVNFIIEGNPCVGAQLTLYDNSAISANSVSWDFGDGNSSTSADSVDYIYNEPGEYEIVYTVVSGVNTFSANKTLIIFENPECSFSVDSVSFSSYTRVFTDESVSSTGMSSYVWDFGDGQTMSTDSAKSEYKYSNAGIYQVWLWSKDVNGCTDSASQNIEVSNIYKVPNVFTPNGDGINDQLVVTVNGFELFSIEIYSRWGNLVFKREKVNNLVWDGGMPDGSKVKPGTYFYVITAHDSQTTYDPESGYLTVFYGKDE